MKIISLNTWGGRAMQSLMHFMRTWRDKVDVFCLQEVHDTTQEYREERHPDEWVRWDLWQKLQERLPDFRGHFARFDDNPDRMSVATFIRRDVPWVSSGDVEMFRPQVLVEQGSAVISPRKLHYIVLLVNGRRVMVLNYHGLWIPEGKEDSPERLKQSRELCKFLDSDDCPKVFCADLNLEPHTEALALLENGRRNLVREFGITSTRTPLYRAYDDPSVSKFADYIIVSPEIRVKEFRVLPDLASDHAALYLDFTVEEVS